MSKLNNTLKTLPYYYNKSTTTKIEKHLLSAHRDAESSVNYLLWNDKEALQSKKKPNNEDYELVFSYILPDKQIFHISLNYDGKEPFFSYCHDDERHKYTVVAFFNDLFDCIADIHKNLFAGHQSKAIDYQPFKDYFDKVYFPKYMMFTKPKTDDASQPQHVKSLSNKIVKEIFTYVADEEYFNNKRRP